MLTKRKQSTCDHSTQMRSVLINSNMFSVIKYMWR